MSTWVIEIDDGKSGFGGKSIGSATEKRIIRETLENNIFEVTKISLKRPPRKRASTHHRGNPNP